MDDGDENVMFPVNRHQTLKFDSSPLKSPSQHAYTSLDTPRTAQRSYSTGSSARLGFAAFAVNMPHPGKANQGEDAYFLSTDGTSLGVSDGVGGWSDLGVDAGDFSRELMGHAKNYVEDSVDNDPQKALIQAVNRTTAKGTATFCMLSLDPEEPILKCSNVGDSGYLHCRWLDDAERWTALHRSEEQQHYFNCPRQLGTNSTDTPDVADVHSRVVKEHDFVVCGTDGLFDNMFVEDILRVLDDFCPMDAWLKALSRNTEDNLLEYVTDALANRAMDRSKSSIMNGPFAVNAAKHGHAYFGGKLDDITVVVGGVRATV